MDNFEEQQYLHLLQRIIEDGSVKHNRTGTNTKSIFGNLMRFKLFRKNGEKIQKILPLLTTKDMSKSVSTIFKELIFFIKGQTNNKILNDQGVKIWNANSSRQFLDSIGLTNRPEGDIGPCFLGDTYVLTEKGYSTIESINMADKICTGNSNFKAINKIHERKYTGKIVKIKSDNIAYNIKATAEHPMLVFNITDNNVNWLSADQLNMDKHNLLIHINDKNIVPEFLQNYSKDIMFVFGYNSSLIVYPYSGINNNITINVEDKNIDIVVNKFKNAFNNTENKISDKYSTFSGFESSLGTFTSAYNIYLTDNLLNIYKDFVINIPNWLIDLPVDYLQEFINGFETYCNGTCKYSFSMSLVMALQKIYNKIGKNINIFKCKNGNYRYTITELNKCVIHDNDNDNNKKKYYAMCSIKELKHYLVENKLVYNFDVETDNTYTVNNIVVHNCYGFQWRHFGAKYIDCNTDYTGKGIDQLQNVIYTIKKNPESRRLIVSAWNPLQLHEMALPPCHMIYQFNVDFVNDKPTYLDCLMYQRSADMPLGVPFNIASYAALTHMVAHLTGLTARELVYVTGDTHIYENQIELAKRQIECKPYNFPNFEFKFNEEDITDINDFKFEHLTINSYTCWPEIKYPFST